MRRRQHRVQLFEQNVSHRSLTGGWEPATKLETLPTALMRELFWFEPNPRPSGLEGLDPI